MQVVLAISTTAATVDVVTAVIPAMVMVAATSTTAAVVVVTPIVTAVVCEHS